MKTISHFERRLGNGRILLSALMVAFFLAKTPFAAVFEFDSSEEMTAFSYRTNYGELYAYRNEAGVGGEPGRVDPISGGFDIPIFLQRAVELAPGDSIRLGTHFYYRDLHLPRLGGYPLRIGLSTSVTNVMLPVDGAQEFLAGGLDRYTTFSQPPDEVLALASHLNGEPKEVRLFTDTDPGPGLYELQTEWTWLGGDEFDAKAQLLFHEDGLGLTPGTQIASLSALLHNPEIAAAPVLYAGFQADSSHIVYLDNLSIEIIPEPGTVPLFLLGGMLGFFAHRARRGSERGQEYERGTPKPLAEAESSALYAFLTRLSSRSTARRHVEVIRPCRTRGNALLRTRSESGTHCALCCQK